MSTLEIQAIDIHVHDRGLNESYKATPETESLAALAGGYVAYLAMPNTKPPVVDKESLDNKLFEAMCQTEVYYGAYVAGVSGNQKAVSEISDRVCGLKLYMNNTTGGLLIDDPMELAKHFYMWREDKPICVHAEGKTLETAIDLARVYGKKLHVCHVSTEEEILMVKAAKEKGLNITCEVTPHHLFLTEDDLSYLGNFGLVKPALGTKRDQAALWKNLYLIDCIVSDSAPHTIEEKNSKNPPYGMPGLETTIPLMLYAVGEGRLSLEKLVDMISTKPKEIFGINNLHKHGTFAQIDMEPTYYLDSANLQTKCAWSPYASPFAAHKMKGTVRNVYVSGELVFKDGESLPRNNSKSLLLFQDKK